MQNKPDILANTSRDNRPVGQTIDLNRWLTAANDDCSDAFKFLKDTLPLQLANGCREMHLEQEPGICRLRCRSNGQLDETRLLSNSLVADLIRTFSVLADQSKASPSDQPDRCAPVSHEFGEFFFNTLVNGGTCRVDAAYYPTAVGICLTLSLINESTIPQTLDQTSLDCASVQLLRDHFAVTPRGITLICSPGTVALQNIFYATLCEINTIERKTVSIEHVVYKNISRINQLQLTGAKGNISCITRLASRHADQVFIDWQSTQQSDLVGDQISGYKPATVFIRAVDASHGVRQLIDSGIDNRQLASSLTAVIELAEYRAICPHCADSHALSSREMQWLEGHTLFREQDARESFVYAPGCDRCEHTGTAQNLTLLSYCKSSETLSDAIESRSMLKIDRALKSNQGARSLSHQLETLVRNGKTSFPEYRHR